MFKFFFFFLVKRKSFVLITQVGKNRRNSWKVKHAYLCKKSSHNVMDLASLDVTKVK